MDMEFVNFNKKLQDNFKSITGDATHLFEVELDKDELWNKYLDSFPNGTNEIYRERREYDCSCCRQFIKTIGNAVIIKDGEIKTIWDFETGSTTFQPVIDELDKFVKSKVVTDIYMFKPENHARLKNRVGIESNRELLDNGDIRQWNHFFLDLPDKFVNKTNRSNGDVKSGFRDTRNVFKRSLDEMTEDSILTVLELISQNSLYRGTEWQSVLTDFLKYKKEYDKINDDKLKELYAWEQSVVVGGVIGRIRNHSMGTLLTNISEDMELDLAIKKYETIVAPENYQRSKPIFTKKMLEDAQNKIKELGFENSLGRRFATLEDITVNNILFSNRDSAKQMGDFDIFAELEKEIGVNPKKYSKVEEVSIDDFVKNVLPNTQEVEVLLENRHSPNMVSLIAPTIKDSKTMFKWNNNFSWAYSGNIADSSMKENVKSAGGKVDGVLRFSIQWNDNEYNPNDFDAHCIEPNGNEIYYGNKNSITGGRLDVDIIDPRRCTPAVENITWARKNRMSTGVYKFFVDNFSHNGGRSGFKAEIEFDGQIHSFEYNKELRHKEKIVVAEVRLDENGNFTIKEMLPSTTSSREVWGLQTNQFVPVSVVMFSPNYWDEQQGIGNKHVFFMLKDCRNTESPNSMYNEFLNNELREHRKVFEALGSKMRVQDTDNQLSGLGFSSTQRNELTVKVKGSTERVIKIKL